jgi:hypothetical protein
VHSGVSVIFSAPTIQLTPGFSAVKGSTFRALPGPVDCANPNLIAGIVNDGDGNPLDAVPICLDESSNSGSCARLSVTDSTGGYLFTDVVQNLPYRVTVDVSNDSNPYPNYAWAPLEHAVVVNAISGNADNLNFTGTFNFSNFQKQIQLTYNDFPELRDYDLLNDYVFLKVYYEVYNADLTEYEENLIYLGRIISGAGLLIEASAPLATTTVYYETYSLDSPTPQKGMIRLQQ